MNKELNFFITSLNYSLNKGSKFKFSELTQDTQVQSLIVFKVDLGNVTFFTHCTGKSYIVYVGKNDRFDLENIIELTTVDESSSTLRDSAKVSDSILKYVESDLIQDLTDLGTFGFELIGVQKLEKQVKLSFLTKDSKGQNLLRQDKQEYVKNIYFTFNQPEAELALILLNLSGNGHITEMVTRFIPSSNSSNLHWHLYNGGIEYELQHSIAWVINNKNYKVQHLKK